MRLPCLSCEARGHRVAGVVTCRGGRSEQLIDYIERLGLVDTGDEVPDALGDCPVRLPPLFGEPGISD